jgi:hypothetical protein
LRLGAVHKQQRPRQQQQHRSSRRKPPRCHPAVHGCAPIISVRHGRSPIAAPASTATPLRLRKTGAATTKRGLNKRHVDLRQGPLAG